ncbi:MAG: hypothetical protein AAF620_05570 [Bacteroidota bacterium]
MRTTALTLTLLIYSFVVFAQLDENGKLRIAIAGTQDGKSPSVVLSSAYNDDFLYDGQYINQYGFGFHGYQDGSTDYINPTNSYLSGYFGIDLFTSGTNRMRIHRSGHIAIGTLDRNINYLLNVNGKVLNKGLTIDDGQLDVIDSKVRVNRANSSDGQSPGLIFRGNDDDFIYDNEYVNHYGFGFHGYQDGTTDHSEPLNSYISGYFGIDFFTSGNNRMRISRNGEVSIGTVNRQPGYLLAVNGSIKSKEVKVEANWSDFVFEKAYNLRTLSEVEDYISKYKHLPEIPSEAEVTENGINLGEMDAKLLQKIEELTLYMIDMNKKVNQLEKANSELKRDNLKLHREVSDLKNK